MNVPRVYELTEAEFEATSVSQRLFAHEYARRFGYIDLPNSKVRAVFSWRSDLLDPCILRDNVNEAIWIGIDEKVAAIASDGTLICTFDLDTPLQSIMGIRDGIVVVSELAAIICDHSGDIQKIVDFPDIAVASALHENKLDVQFVDGNTREFSLD